MTAVGLKGGVLLALIAAIASATETAAQSHGVIAGRALTADDLAAADAEVRIVSLGRRVRVDSAGSFSIDRVPAGTHVLELVSVRWGRAMRRVAVEPGETVVIDVRLVVPTFHLEGIVVAAGEAARQSDISQATSVVSGAELLQRAEASLGETLRKEPGVASTYFGPAAARPIIRGLGGDRVRVLENGIDVGDASNTSPDHAVSVDPATSERIEVVRGPATLLYGSSAIGGVVNVVDGRIPDELPSRPATGSITLRGGTVADELNGAASLTVAVGPVAVHVSGLRRTTDDYSIPGFAVSDPSTAPSGQFGVVENSALESTRGSGGLSVIGAEGFLGASVSGFDSEYGIPSEDVSIDLSQRRADLEGAWRPLGALVREVRLQAGRTDYQHDEIEDGQVGTEIRNDLWEVRAEARHALTRSVHGSLGLQASRRDFSALGDEAYVPRTQTDRYALFIFEELSAGPVRYQVGVRYERADVTDNDNGLNRVYDAVSVSGGANWAIDDRWALVVTGARSTKLPSAEELYSDGPHAATRAYEVGNPNLDPEVGYNLELSLRAREGRVTGAVTGFITGFSAFTHLANTPSVRDGLPVFVYQQRDALFSGFEAEATVELFHYRVHHVGLRVWSDFVRAELTASDEPLPRIPPLRIGAGLQYEGSALRAEVDVRRVQDQNRVSAFEAPTPGYTMLDASIGYRIFSGPMIHEISVQAVNLSNEEARTHVSFLKNVAPLPGREIRGVYRLLF